MNTIRIDVHGGLVQYVDKPPSLADVKVVVRDYDVDGVDDGLKQDESGCPYIESEW